jgi:hypothetical protein
MLRKRKIKAIYMLEAYCNKCGSPMVSTGMVYSTYPEQYPYACTNKECDGHETFWAYERPGKFEYEFEEDENG